LALLFSLFDISHMEEARSVPGDRTIKRIVLSIVQPSTNFVSPTPFPISLVHCRRDLKQVLPEIYLMIVAGCLNSGKNIPLYVTARQGANKNKKGFCMCAVVLGAPPLLP
jgi:hypothetical protein